RAPAGVGGGSHRGPGARPGCGRGGRVSSPGRGELRHESVPLGDGNRRVPLWNVARDWTRSGVTGFGGPPAHIRLLRRLVVERQRWLDPREFEDAIAACNLLPGPASTQLAIFSARRVAGPLGAVVGGLGFVLPAVAAVLVLST